MDMIPDTIESRKLKPKTNVGRKKDDMEVSPPQAATHNPKV
jgi:hypothetical protein